MACRHPNPRTGGDLHGHRSIRASRPAPGCAALDGVDVVIDATNTPGSGRKAWPVVVDGTRRLLTAEAQAGVGRHVAISIVGIDKVPLSNHRAKLAQERLVEEGPVPWSILSATQLHELLDLAFR